MSIASSRILTRSVGSAIRPVLASPRSTLIKTPGLSSSSCCGGGIRLFSATKMATFPTPSTDRPRHEMQYFPGMLTALPAESAEFRRVLWTGLYSQLVLMTVPVGGDIGDEVHTVDQILTFTSGTGLAQIAGKEQKVQAGDLIIVPAGTRHQFVNTGQTPLLLYTVYSPAEHKPTTVHPTKVEGDMEEEQGRDEPPEWSQKSKEENEREGWVKVSS